MAAIAKTQSRNAEDVDRVVDDFKYFCQHYVVTEYTDPVTEQTSPAPYPDYPYLDQYTQEIAQQGLLVVPKAREMLATTHPLVCSLHRCVGVWKRGGIWRTAIVRQSQGDANELIKRTRAVWERLPRNLQPPLVTDNQDRMLFEGGGEIRALNADGDAGRGETWDLVILDEGAFQRYLARNIGAFGPRSRTIIVPSTYNGEGDTFCALVDGDEYPGRRVFPMPHSLHPGRIEGTPEGDAYLALKRSKMSNSDFLREIKMRRDVYKNAGYYGSDYREEVVRPVEWDGKAIVTIGMDYSYLHPAAVVSYVNDHGQFCRMREYLHAEQTLEAFCGAVFSECKSFYHGSRFRVAPDPFRGRQTKGDTDAFGNPATDLATIRRLAQEILGQDTLVSISQTGSMLRPEGHRRVRRLFAMREDQRYGTIIDPKCKRLIQGFSGAYGPSDNATSQQLQNEEPDANRIQVHVMDADRYGVCEFVQVDRGVEFRKPSERPKPTIVTPRNELTSPSMRSGALRG